MADNIKTYRSDDGCVLTVNWDLIKPGEIEIVGDQVIIQNKGLVEEIVRQVAQLENDTEG